MTPVQRLKGALEEVWVALFGWIPTPLGIVLRNLAWRFCFRRCGSARFATGISFAGMGSMSFGDGVRIGRLCIVTAQGQIIVADIDGNRIPQGSRTKHLHLRARNKPHGHQPFLQSGIANLLNFERHAGFSILQRQKKRLLK